MNELSGRGRTSDSPDGKTSGRASNETSPADPFGLESYTGQPSPAIDPEEPTQPDRVESARPDGKVETRWQTYLGEPVVGGPVAHDTNLIVTSQSSRIYTLDASDGTERWRSANEIATTPPTAKSGQAFVGHENGFLRAIDIADGSAQWTYEVDGQIATAPVVKEDLVYATTDRGAVYLIDADRGDRHAAFGHGSQAVCALTADRETIFLGSASGGLQARCTADGRERWRCLPEKAVVSPPAVTDEHVFVATIDGETVLEIDRVTGTLQHRYEIKAAVWGQPVVTDDVLVVAGQDGVLTAFNRASASRRWQIKLRGSAWSGPTIDGGRIYVADDRGQTYAFGVQDGILRWQFDAGTPITTAPTVTDGVVVVATEAGTVYALAETGI